MLSINHDFPNRNCNNNHDFKSEISNLTSHIYMTLKTLIEKHTWQAIASVFLKTYPKAEENMAGYQQVFEKLSEMESETTGMSIIVKTETDDDEDYVDVSGLNIHPKTEEDHYPQGLELTPWKQWLGMEISNESLKEFSEQEILVHCLYEMTFEGFSEDAIQKTSERIEKSCKARQSNPEAQDLVSEEDVFKLLDSTEDAD